MRRRIVAAAVGIAALSATLARSPRRGTSPWSRCRVEGPRATSPPTPRRPRPTAASWRSPPPPTWPACPTPAVQLYVRDRVTGTTVLALVNAAGEPANAAVDAQDVDNVQFAISGNGRYVVFASAATNLRRWHRRDKDVFRKDLQTGAVTLVSVNTAGQKANAAVFGDPDVSYDGRAVSFGSGDATNLFAGDGNNASDIIVRDIVAGTTVAGRPERGRRPGERHHRALGASAPTATSWRSRLRRGPPTCCPGDSPAGATTSSSATWRPARPPAPATRPPRRLGLPRHLGRRPLRRLRDRLQVRRRPTTPTPPMTSTAGTWPPGRSRSPRRATDGTPRRRRRAPGRAISADGARVAFTSLVDGPRRHRRATTPTTSTSATRPPATRRASVAADGTTAGNTASESQRHRRKRRPGVVRPHRRRRGHQARRRRRQQPAGRLRQGVRPHRHDAARPGRRTGPTGTATDPSGIGEVTVNGAPVAVAADGSFAVPSARRGPTCARSTAPATRVTVTRVIPPRRRRGRRARASQRLKAIVEGQEDHGALPPVRRRARHGDPAAPDGPARSPSGGSC